MTSAEVIAANERNARHSTGPRTTAGKRKVAKNALRHGVLASLYADAAMSAEVAQIAAALAGPDAPPRLRAHVVPIAEAHVDMLRARRARVAMINLAAETTPGDPTEAVARSLPSLLRLDRYERSAMRRRHRALRELRKFFTSIRK